MSDPHILSTPDDVRAFVLAGNATFTLRSKRTNTRFTFKIRKPKEDSPHFVSLMTGTDNENSFRYLGTIFPSVGRPEIGLFARTAKSRIAEGSPGVVAFRWFWDKLRAGQLHESLEVWHEGACGRCGRKLTVPESIARGLGPECATRLDIRPQYDEQGEERQPRFRDSMDEFTGEIQRREEREEKARMDRKFGILQRN
jgi:hypothetical protein